MASIREFLNRSPGEHLRAGFGDLRHYSWGAFRDATGVGFAQGVYFRSKWRQLAQQAQHGPRYRRQVQLERTARYYKLRSKGYTGAQAMQSMRGRSVRHFPSGVLFGGLGLINTAYTAATHKYGPIYGAAADVGETGLAVVGGRLGWAAGAAMGATIGGPPGAVIGAIIGGIGGGIVPAMAFSYLNEELPSWGSRLGRRGFGNLWSPYRDTQQAATMRQASLAAIGKSHMNARNALGGEAAILHFS